MSDEGKVLPLKRRVGSIDIEPTWVLLVGPMLEVLANPKARPEARQTVRNELHKMARAADAYRALQKKGKVP